MCCVDIYINIFYLFHCIDHHIPRLVQTKHVMILRRWYHVPRTKYADTSLDPPQRMSLIPSLERWQRLQLVNINTNRRFVVIFTTNIAQFHCSALKGQSFWNDTRVSLVLTFQQCSNLSVGTNNCSFRYSESVRWRDVVTPCLRCGLELVHVAGGGREKTEPLEMESRSIRYSPSKWKTAHPMCCPSLGWNDTSEALLG